MWCFDTKVSLFAMFAVPDAWPAFEVSRGAQVLFAARIKPLPRKRARHFLPYCTPIICKSIHTYPQDRLYPTRGDISCTLSKLRSAKWALGIFRRGAKQDSESSCFDHHAHICCGLDGYSLGKLQWIQFNALEVRSQDLLELWTPS